MKKLIILLSLLILTTSCAGTKVSNKALSSKRGYMLLELEYMPRNKKFLEQNLRGRRNKIRRMQKRGKNF